MNGIVEDRYSRWRVLNKRVIGRKVLCVCDCGEVRFVNLKNLRNGATKSCGCYNRESAAQRKYKHGKTKTPEWYAWQEMRRRCYDKKRSRYPRYGGRGIKVCDRWNSFESFYEDMGQKPSKRHTLGRINNDGDYCPENCRWETIEQQANNRSNNKIIVFKGEHHTMSEWCRIKGISYSCLKNRLRR